MPPRPLHWEDARVVILAVRLATLASAALVSILLYEFHHKATALDRLIDITTLLTTKTAVLESRIDAQAVDQAMLRKRIETLAGRTGP